PSDPARRANTTARTRPSASTAGPPELPGRTSARIVVTSRATGKRPYASRASVGAVVPSRPGSAWNGPFSGKPSTATETSLLGVAAGSGGARRPGTESTARSLLASKATTRPTCARPPSTDTRGRATPPTTWAFV